MFQNVRLIGKLRVTSDVISAAEELSVEVTCLVVLRVLRLEVDVGLPQRLGHVEARLRDGQPEDGACARGVAQDRLQLRKLNKHTAWQSTATV